MESHEATLTLESQYREVSSATVIAKAHFLALLEEGATPPFIRRAREHWLEWDERQRAVAARMGADEDCGCRRAI